MSTINSPQVEGETENQQPLTTRRKVLLALGALAGFGGLYKLKNRSDKINSENFEIERQKKDKAMYDSYIYAVAQKPKGDDEETSKLLSNKFKELYKLDHLPNLNLKWRKVDKYILYLPASQFDAMDPLAVGGYEILEDGNLRRIEYNDSGTLRDKFNIQYGEK